MQPAEPVETAGRSLLFGDAKNFTPATLRSGLIKTRGNPLLRFPPVSLLIKRFQVPLPLHDLLLSREDSNQPKWVDAIERQIAEFIVGKFGRCKRAHGFNDLSSTYGIGFDPSGRRIPVNQSKGDPAVIDHNPGATAGLRGAKNRVSAYHFLSGLKTRNACQSFVTIHSEVVSSPAWNERNGTHISVQSAAGYVAACREYCRHVFHMRERLVGEHPRRRLAAPMANTRSHCRNRVRYATTSELRAS